MTPKMVLKLLTDVAKLKTDMQWVKKYIYISVTASVTAALGALGQLIHSLLLLFHH